MQNSHSITLTKASTTVCEYVNPKEGVHALLRQATVTVRASYSIFLNREISSDGITWAYEQYSC